MTMRPLLLANRGFVLGGGEVGLEILVDGLIERAIDPLVVLPTDGSLVAGRPIDRRVADRSSLQRTLIDAVAECTVIHTYSVDGFLAATSFDHDRPVMLHALVPNESKYDPAIAARADLLLCNSVATAERFRGSDRVRVLLNGVPEPTPVAEADRVADPTKLSIAMIGPVSPRKGHYDALPPLLALTQRRHDVEVLYMGRATGLHGRMIRKVTADDPRQRVLGFVQDAGNHLLDCQLLLAPSLSEGFGRMAAEALRAGVPVLSRPIDGLVEVLSALDDPWLPDDRSLWEARIERELDRPTHTPDELRAFGERFGADIWIDGIVDEYRRLTDRVPR